MILSPFGPIYPILIPLPWETVWGSMCVLTELLDSQIQCIMPFFFLFDFVNFIKVSLAYGKRHV